MRFFNITEEKKRGGGARRLGIINWTLQEAGAERNGPKFSEQPYSRSLMRCKETNRIFLINIFEIKGRTTIFILRVEERRGMLHLRFLIF
jgi:hypothetical protein